MTVLQTRRMGISRSDTGQEPRQTWPYRNTIPDKVLADGCGESGGSIVESED